MDRFAALSTFVVVAERAGFAAAARQLSMSPPAVTRTIAALEAHLGAPLLHRSTRAVTLTEAGAAFLDRARTILADLHEAEQIVMGRQETPRGELHVTAPVVFGRLYVLPVVADLIRAHPELSIRLLLLDRNIRLVEEGVDIAVRIGELRDSSLKATRIGSVGQLIVGSPQYCARRGRPVQPRDLADHDLIADDAARTGGFWRFGPKATGVQITPRLRVSSVDAQLAAAAAGLGLTNVLSYQAVEGLASGALCSVLDEHAPPALPVHLLFDANRTQTPAARVFIEAMAARARRDLPRSGAERPYPGSSSS
jgi:DNA-binding transcriptional LysR family regulator